MLNKNNDNKKGKISGAQCSYSLPTDQCQTRQTKPSQTQVDPPTR